MTSGAAIVTGGVAGAVSWLLGPDAEFVTGEVISVTGGFQAYGVAPAAEAVRAAARTVSK